MNDPEHVAKGLKALLPINADMECCYCAEQKCVAPPKDGIHRDLGDFLGAQACLWGSMYDGIRELVDIPIEKYKAKPRKVASQFISLREIVAITGRSRNSMKRWLDKAEVPQTRFGTSAISYNRTEFFKWLGSRLVREGA